MINNELLRFYLKYNKNLSFFNFVYILYSKNIRKQLLMFFYYFSTIRGLSIALIARCVVNEQTRIDVGGRVIVTKLFVTNSISFFFCFAYVCVCSRVYSWIFCRFRSLFVNAYPIYQHSNGKFIQILLFLINFWLFGL